jgi:hypothetical protein
LVVGTISSVEPSSFDDTTGIFGETTCCLGTVVVVSGVFGLVSFVPDPFEEGFVTPGAFEVEMGGDVFTPVVGVPAETPD